MFANGVMGDILDKHAVPLQELLVKGPLSGLLSGLLSAPSFIQRIQGVPYSTRKRMWAVPAHKYTSSRTVLSFTGQLI